MQHKFLKLAGVKTEEEFYAKFPTEEAFFKAHPDAHPSYAKGEKLKAAWGAELGTNQFEGGPMPINPYPQGFKIPKLDAMGNPISDPVPNIGGATPWIAKGQPNPLAPVPSSTTPVPYAPGYKPAQTQEWHGPQVEGSQEFENGLPDNHPDKKQTSQPAGRTSKAPVNKEKKPLSMPEGAGGGGMTGQGILAGLEMYDAFMGPDRTKRRYVRPEDMQSYNANTYGTGSQAISEYGNTLKGKKKAFWGALIGAAGSAGIKPVQGLHNNINEGMAPLMNVANQATERANYLDTADLQNTANLQNIQQFLPNQQPQYMANGGEMKFNMGGELQTGEGGNTSLASYNPFDGGTFQFNGDSHEKGGIDISYKGNPAEVEGGETAFKDQEGDLKIMGNLKVPGTNMKYKAFSKKLADKEEKAQKYIDKGSILLNTASPEDPYELLAFNSGRAMTIGGLMKQKQLSELKQHLGDMQEAHLETIKEGKAEKAAKGKTLEDPTKPWQYKGTNVKNLDPKIKEFVSLLEKKGITGYSGEQGGFRKGSMTKSGNKSRHSSNQALDLIPVEGEAAYQKILKDPELTSFLINNGLTAINEYSSDNAKLTGATAGHIHIGRDKGTKLADQFRNEAASLYPDQFKSVSGKYKTPKLTSFPGDAQTENTPGFINKPYNIPSFDYTPGNTAIQTVEGSNTPLEIKQPSPLKKPSNARGLSPLQLMGEGYALATNTVEPVKAQLYNPELFQPYQVSFQDRLNENNATYKGIEKQLAYDPTALSTLAGQKYQANSSVLADEFRTNQQIANDITNKNVSLLNEAKKDNLSILDTQYVRQETAKSKTKEINQMALNSISSKMLQKEASNNQLRVLENLYPDYAFDKRTGKAQYYGPDAASQIDWTGVQPAGNQGDRKKIETKTGNVKTTQYFDSPVDESLKALQLQEKRASLYKPKSLSYYWKNSK